VNEYLIQKETLDDIASAIQEKAAPAQDFTVADFGDLIRGIESSKNKNIEFYKSVLDGTVTEITEENLEGINSFRYSAFQFCNSLKKITIPKRFTTFPQEVFASCSALTEVKLLAEKCVLGHSAFAHCSFESFDMSNVTDIRNYTFNGCKQLVDIDLSKLITIPMGSFSDCKSLININLSSVTNFSGSSSFSNCTSLISVTLPDTPPSLYSTNCFPVSNPGFKFHVSSAEVEAAYMSATNWSTYGSDVFTYPGKEET
jgi:hypothetical protein